ncbi:5'-nucleotidase C-terminal domain-containing protein [Paenibacillus beijingensis]|uniref:5'-nucleotidase C-terminal domain-containing protein n=1 Tax=Paenibacillus beijingensis TaxID=1126833 RepID=UPI0006970232|nr:5'-nucleotidase C-terminal domain-containing protein [Paenibacillus beijingensis]
MKLGRIDFYPFSGQARKIAALAISGALALQLTGIGFVSAHSGTADTSKPNLVGEAYEKSKHPLTETTLTIVHDTHFHGNYGNAGQEENISNYFGVVNQIRNQQPNSLFIANGDDLATSVLSSTFKGRHIVDAFNAGKVDVDTFGNHDFDMGPDQLAERVKESQFTWVSANVIDKRTNDVFAATQGAKRYVIKEVNGVKVGITGLINEEAPEITSMGENAFVLPAVEAMKKIVPEMKQAGAQLIVVSSHLASPDARVVAEEVDGIDLIVGDHAAFAYESPEKIHDTLLWFIGDEFEFVGEINLQVKEGKIADFNYKRHTVKEEAAKAGFQPDAAVKAVMDKYNSELSKELSIVIGKTGTELDVMKASQRNGETAIGSFITDSVRAYTNADVALINGGGIRADRVFPAGDLTKQDIMDAMPFTNYVVKIEVTGKQLMQALENGVSEIEKGAGRFAQVSGMAYSFNPELPAGSRIVTATVGGKPIDPDKTYTLATVDFIANGGDGYEMFKDANVLLDANAGPLLSGLIIEAIQKQGAIAPKTDGRIAVSQSKPKETEPAKPVESTKPAVPAKPTKPAEPSKPAKPAKPSTPAKPALPAKTEIIYIVHKGDWLSKIAPKYGLTWQELAEYNRLSDPDFIVVGQKLRIPIQAQK